MQCLPSKTVQGGCRQRWKPGCLGPKTGAVDVVAQQRMANMGEMDPDLVGAAGLQATGQQAGYERAVGARIALQHLPMRNGVAAASAHGHFVAGMWVAVDRLVDRT